MQEKRGTGINQRAIDLLRSRSTELILSDYSGIDLLREVNDGGLSQ